MVLGYCGCGTITSVTPNNGPLAGGNNVTIVGTSLGTITGVTLASVDALIVTASPTSVIVVAGHSVQSGVGSVEIASDQPSSLANGYTYNPGLGACFSLILMKQLEPFPP